MSNSNDIGTPEQSPVHPILRSLQVLQTPATVFEIRVLGVPRGNYKPGNAAGWFNDPQAAFNAVSTYVMKKATGIYVTLNPVNPALLARTNNQIRDNCEHATADKDIVRREWLMLDFDPERPDGISSSQAELAAALNIAAHCRNWLRRKHDWPDPVEAMSGNGIHLIYGIDLPNDESAKQLIQKVLQGISQVVHDRQAGNAIQIKLDPVNFNASRIIKLWGTPARKGADTADRPHRTSEILRVPEQIEILSVEKLNQVAALAPVSKATASTAVPVSKSTPANPELLNRARKYMAKVPPAIAGQHGHNVAFRAACILVKELRLSVEDALPILREWSETCQPPWTDAELIHKLASASKQPGSPPDVKLPVVEFIPFPVHCLPDPVRMFVIETAESMRCDPCFIVLPLLAAVAAAVGNSRRIRLKLGWTEPCVFWLVVIAESGTMKSPGLEAALAFLKKLQAKAYADYERAMEQYQRDLLKYDADLADHRKQSPNRVAEPPEPPPKPVCQRFICEDSTIEALAAVLDEQCRGLVMVRDELSGWLSSFDAYKSAKGADVAQWLSMHRAGSMTIDRKSGKRITYIPHAAVSIAGGIQPITMATALAGRYRPAKEAPEVQPREHFDNGLAARLLMAMPPRTAKVWTDQDVSPEICEKMQRLFADLVSLEMGTDENGKPCPIDLKFTRKAHAQWVKFYNEHALEQVQLNGDMAAAWSKLEGYAARLALMTHLVRYAANDPTLKDSDQIDEVSLAAGIEISRWFGDEASRIYTTIGARTETHEQRERRLLLRAVKKGQGGITPRELMRHCRCYRNSVSEAEAALQTLVDAELGFWRDRPTTGKGGRPTQEFVLHEQADQEVSSPSPPAEDVPQSGIQSDDPDLDLSGLDLP